MMFKFIERYQCLIMRTLQKYITFVFCCVWLQVVARLCSSIQEVISTGELVTTSRWFKTRSLGPGYSWQSVLLALEVFVVSRNNTNSATVSGI